MNQRRTEYRSTDFDAAVGWRIRAHRTATGMNQTELGHAIGVSFQQIRKYEYGTNTVSAGTLLAIALTLDVPVTAFFEGLETRGFDAARRNARTSPLAQRLRRAFAHLRDKQTQSSFLQLVESIAAREGRRS